MKCMKCGRRERKSGKQGRNNMLCAACFKVKRGGENVHKMRAAIRAAKPKTNGNVKRVRIKVKAKRVTFKMLAGLPPTNETYGVVMRERAK